MQTGPKKKKKKKKKKSSLNAPLDITIPFLSLRFAGDPRRREASMGKATHKSAPLTYGNVFVEIVALFGGEGINFKSQLI
jgi:hypothetical protein